MSGHGDPSGARRDAVSGPGDPAGELATPFGLELARALAAHAGDRGLVLVAPARHPLAAAVRAAGGAVVAVEGAQVRPAVAGGLVLAGRPAAVVLGPVAPSGPPVEGLVAATTDARVAAACWGAGWTVAQPAWPRDVAPLLDGALAAGDPVVLRLPPGPVATPHGVAPPAGTARFGRPRLVRDGTAGLLAASGAAPVMLLTRVGEMLAGRGVPVAAAELHTARPGQGPGPLVTERSLLVAAGGSADRLGEGDGWPAGLVAVEVPDDPHGALEAVAARLRARP